MTTTDHQATIRLFGRLHSLQRERGLPTTLTHEVPRDGMSARDLAVELDLPLDLIEGVFCNRVVYGLDRIVMPGDRVAFVPTGTPGPHRFMLGLYAAGEQQGRGTDPE